MLSSPGPRLTGDTWRDGGTRGEALAVFFQSVEDAPKAAV